jgi:hypothetical protein
MTSQLTMLARKMMLTPSQAVALPQVITQAAAGQQMTEQALVDILMSNSAAAGYVASICRSVVK